MNDRRVTPEVYLAAVRKYAEVHGTTYLPHGAMAGDLKIGRWVDTRRRRRGINPEIDRALEAIPGWAWETRLRTGDPVVDYAKQLAALNEHVALVGHSRVPADYVTPDGMHIGTWVSKRRAGRGQYPTLDAVLEATPGWAWSLSIPARDGGVGHSALLRHVRDGGTARMPVSFVTDDGIALGSWVADQRTKRGCDPAFDAKLEALPGWTWRAVVDDPIERHRRNLDLLIEFVKVNGHARPALTYVTSDGTKLGAWVGARRAWRGKAPTLDAELEKFPGWSWGRSATT